MDLGTLEGQTELANIFIRELAKSLPEQRFSDASVLDMFCGNGYFLGALGALRTDWNLYGFDANRSLITAARKFSPNSTFNVFRFPPMSYHNDSFDIVISNMALDYADTRRSSGFPTTFNFTTLAVELSRIIVPEGYFCPLADSATRLEREILSDLGLQRIDSPLELYQNRG